MKKAVLIPLLILNFYFSEAQTVKIMPGISYGKVNLNKNKNSKSIYDTREFGPSMFIGIDFFEKEVINFFSYAGFMSIAGSYNDSRFICLEDLNNDYDFTEKARFNYVSFIEGVKVKHCFNENLKSFFSFGVQGNYLIKSNSRFDYLKEFNSINKITLGINSAIDIMYCYKNFEYGISISYYSPIDKTIDYVSEYNSKIIIYTEAINFNLIFGYDLN